jgi:hypothetical protein
MVSTVSTLIQYSAEIITQSNKARKGNKERSQIILFSRWYDPILKSP